MTKKREKETNTKKEIETRNFEQNIQDILTFQKYQNKEEDNEESWFGITKEMSTRRRKTWWGIWDAIRWWWFSF